MTVDEARALRPGDRVKMADGTEVEVVKVVEIKITFGRTIVKIFGTRHGKAISLTHEQVERP